MICAIESCDRRPKARGWCDKHYSRWQRTGDPEKVRRTLKPCGTRAAYFRHLARGESACEACEAANREYDRQRRGKPEPFGRSARNAIVDVLSTYTEWMTFSVLVGRVQLHRPDLTEINIRRSVDRLRNEGRLQVRERMGLLEYFTDEWAATA